MPPGRPAIWPHPAPEAIGGESVEIVPTAPGGETFPGARFSLWDILGALLAGVAGVLASAAIYPIILLLQSVPVSALRGIVPVHLERIAIVSSVAGYAAIFLFLIWRGRRRGFGARDMGFAPFAWRWLAAAALILVGLRIVSGVLHFTLTDADVGKSIAIAKAMMPGGFFWNSATAVLIVVFAPLTEELFFRVALFGSLTRFLPRIGAAVISVVVFAALHTQYSTAGGWLALVLTSDVGLLGAALMWLYLRSRSIWPSVLLHAVSNGLTVAALLAFLSSKPVPI
jgi:membrane protease YdiL (CAAX protease family)